MPKLLSHRPKSVIRQEAYEMRNYIIGEKANVRHIEPSLFLLVHKNCSMLNEWCVGDIDHPRLRPAFIPQLRNSTIRAILSSLWRLATCLGHGNSWTMTLSIEHCAAFRGAFTARRAVLRYIFELSSRQRHT